MINAFKFDAFKISRSLTIKIFLFVCLLMCFLNPIFAVVNSRGQAEVMILQIMASTFGTHEFVIILFAAAFLSQDYFSGYIHNVYSKQNKTAYVMSKVCWIMIFCVVYIVLEFVLYNFAFLFSSVKNVYVYKETVLVINGNKIIYTVWDYVRALLLRILEMCVIGNAMMLFTVLIRNGFIVAIGTLVYMFFSAPLFRAINDIIGAKNFDLTKFTATGISMQATYNAPENLLWQALIVMFVYLAITIAGSVLIYRKRRF